MGMLLDDFAEVARAEGDVLRAARLKGAAGTMRHVTEAQVANPSESPWLSWVEEPELPTDPVLIERARVEGEAMTATEAIAYALGSEAVPANDEALAVTTLGPFAVERAGTPVTRWGGEKAGSRQAQAMFAFLLDRGEHGVTKDECIEVIWPDADLTQGDLNFHRTLAGLRATIEPDVALESRTAIRFANGRYRLDSSIIRWLDATEFERHLTNAPQATDDLAVIRGLEAARALYRGDYLDDCPIYGDSAYVQERRRFLRGRYCDALVELGARYEARGKLTLAATRYREALRASGDDHPSAAEGLKRVGGASG
jgi:two-component SAPR family response regulator